MSTNNRASLLAGLRTGGVRSTSGSAMPHTAAPGASFQIPRFVSSSHPTANNANNHYQDEEADYVADTLGQTLNINPSRRTTIPLTASAADAGVPKFQQLQQQALLRQAANQRSALNSNNNNNQQQQQAFLNQLQQMGPQAQAQAQAQLLQLWQMQQMQMQMMLAQQQQQQQQQYQPEVNAPTQRPSFSALRAPGRQQQPSTAGPMQTSFNLPPPARHRVPQFEQPLSDDPGPVPMTAALGGKFGSRSLPNGLNGGFSSGEDEYKNYTVPSNPPLSASYQHTTVISGGTSLGAIGSPQHNSSSVTPSKSDSAISWRRSGVNNSVLRNTPLRAATLANPPTVTISSPNGEDIDGSDHAPPAFTPIRTRPQPLRFNIAASKEQSTVTMDMSGDGNPTQTIAINGNGVAADGTSSPSSGSLPPTPPSATSSLSAREEASKKLYEGLGIGRPAPAPQQLPPQQQPMQYGSPNSMSIVAAAVAARAVSQPLRQPRGPPSGTEDFGAKNFASRIRRQAIGGLGALMDARERRDGGVEVEAY